MELFELCKEMYVKGIWPSDFTRVVMILLQKKKNAVECVDHRTISLISHASKILLKILTNRIEAKARDFIDEISLDLEKVVVREMVLQSIGVDWRDRRMISELYMSQEAVVRIADGESDSRIIGRGVRQGCPPSPLLFLIYAKMMMKEALENVEEGYSIRAGGELIKNVKYADDQGMLANTKTGLQSLMENLNTTAKHYD